MAGALVTLGSLRMTRSSRPAPAFGSAVKIVA